MVRPVASEAGQGLGVATGNAEAPVAAFAAAPPLLHPGTVTVVLQLLDALYCSDRQKASANTLTKTGGNSPLSPGPGEGAAGKDSGMTRLVTFCQPATGEGVADGGT